MSVFKSQAQRGSDERQSQYSKCVRTVQSTTLNEAADQMITLYVPLFAICSGRVGK